MQWSPSALDAEIFRASRAAYQPVWGLWACRSGSSRDRTHVKVTSNDG